jgi:hypothetical protein
VACEVPDNEQWLGAISPFWRALTAKHTDSYEGTTASSIHNPTIRYFRQLLAGTIFGRANSNKVNSKEIFYLFATIWKERVNFVPFMLSHMRSLVSAKRGSITFGGLITTIARAIGLGPRLANLEPIPGRFIDFDLVKSMNLVREQRDGKFNLIY